MLGKEENFYFSVVCVCMCVYLFVRFINEYIDPLSDVIQEEKLVFMSEIEFSGLEYDIFEKLRKKWEVVCCQVSMKIMDKKKENGSNFRKKDTK